MSPMTHRTQLPVWLLLRMRTQKRKAAWAVAILPMEI
jgi:hypothetical protein